MKLGKRYLACVVLAMVMVISLGLFAACSNDTPTTDSSSGNSSITSDNGSGNNSETSDGGSGNNSETSDGGSGSNTPTTDSSSGSNSPTSSGTQPIDPPKPHEAPKGEYYCVDGDKEYKLSFADNMAVVLDMGNGEKQAKFTFDGTEATWEVDGVAYSVTFVENGNKVDLTVDKSNYTFWKKVEFIVTYEVNGGSKIEPSKALNGKPANKPSDPKKDGYYFVGWFKDAEFKEAYSFENDIITADTTIYAQFMEYFDAEFKVEFDLNYENAPAINAVNTVQNKLQYNLPTPVRDGYKFIGWWLSDFNSAEKLTAKYVDQVIKQNTKLYAVWEEEGKIYVSFNQNEITWESAGVNVNYTVTVTTPNGEEQPILTQKLVYEYSLKDAPAGDYSVKVKGSNGCEGYAYYKNKQLDPVSVFMVDDATATLKWNAVENATNYYLTYKCADENHKHNEVKVTNSTSYTFKDCDMPEGGFMFTVMATAQGYSSSTSETFTYNKKLDKPNKLAVADGTMLTWDAVENAQYYEVYVGETKYVALANSFSLENHNGALEIKVVAKARTMAKSEEATLAYTREKLATPKNLTVNGGQVSWDAVNGATSYVVTIDGKEFTADKNAFTLADTNFDAAKATHTLTVQAKGATDATKSLSSKEVNFTADTVNPLSYEDGKVYWAVVNDVTGYVIKVNGGKEVKVDANAYYADVRLTKAGDNKIEVAYLKLLDGMEVTSVWATMTVEAVGLRVNLAGAQEVGEGGYLYFKKGTVLNLNDVTAMVKRDGYTLAGWYNKEDGRNTNGARYYDDVPLVLNGDKTIYAAWIGNKYKITLDLDGAKLPEDNNELVYTVRIGDTFTLPVPYLEGDTTKIFLGWYEEPNGEGKECTNENGYSGKGGYKFFEDRTFYPKWVDVFTFKEIASLDSNYKKAYSVAKSDAIAQYKLAEVTVPVMYNGYPVTTIEANGFQSCSSLVTFNMPNTIINVESTAFKYCSKLKTINVYDAGSVSPRYFSDGGVLYRDDNVTGKVEVGYVPLAKDGVYEIPYGVDVIPNEAFKDTKIKEISIPATVTYIGKDAFYDYTSATGVKKITFLPQIEGQDELPLYLSANAFNNAKLFTSIDLPARTALITDEGRWLYDVFGKNTAVENVNIVGNPAKETVTNKDGTVAKKDIITYTSKDGVVYKDEGKTLVYYPYKKGGEFVTDSNVTKIDEYAFAYNTKITSITIAGQVTEVGDYAFLSCTGVLKLEFQGISDYEDLKIGREAFYGLTKVTEVTLPGNVKSIGLNAFGYCSKLETVKVYFDERIYEYGEQGEKVLQINADAFANRKSSTSGATASKITYITTLYLGPNVPTIDINEIFGGSKLVNLSVDPRNPYYGTYGNDGVMYGKDENGELENIAFYPTTKEGEYVVPTGIRSIGALVFNNKDLLRKITIPHTVTKIGDDAFALCDGLREVIFLPTPEGEEPKDLVIGNRVFRSCSKIKEISFPERTTQLGDAVFIYASNLTTVNLPTTLNDLVETISGTGDDVTISLETFNTGTTTSQLAAINVAEGSKHFTSIDGVLYSLKEVKTTVNGQEVTEYVPDALITCPIQNGGKDGYIVIPATVNRIWDKAFCYNKLVKSITFEERTVNEGFTIGKQVFYSASNLANLELPYGLTEVSSSIFYGCSTLQELVIPQTVSFIGSSAFSGCTALKKIVFLDDGEREKDNAVDLVIEDSSSSSGVFRPCDSLEEVIFPIRGYKPAVVDKPTEEGGEPVTHPAQKATITIGAFAFNGYPAYSGQPYRLLNLKNVKLTENVTMLGNYAFYGSPLTSFTIPNENITFGNSVFSNAYNLKSFTLPAKMTQIPNYMFNKSGLTSITIPATVETIGTTAFGDCINLTTVTFEKQEVTAQDGTVSMVTSLKEIGQSAFNGCTSLTSIEIPESVTTIKLYAFSETGLTSVHIPASVETIEGSAFSKSAALTSVTFAEPSNLKLIKKNAFNGAPIKDFKFPVSKNEIELEDLIFGESTILETVYLSESIHNITDVFNGCSALKKIKVSDKSEHFSADENLPLVYSKDRSVIRLTYGTLDSSFTLFNGVDENNNPISTITEIADNAFIDQTGITSLTIPKSVIKIGDDAFNGCTGITELIFEKGGVLTTIGVRAFKGCTGLKEVELPASIQYLYDQDGDKTGVSGYQFADCTNLEKVTFATDSKIEILGKYAFMNCVSLKEFTIPETVYRIDDSAFQGCIGLKEITFPASLGSVEDEEMGNYIFRYCKNLETVHFPTEMGLTSLPDGMFASCVSLKYSTIGEGEAVPFTVPDYITSIGNGAFELCVSLDEIKLGANTNTIGKFAFKNTGVKKVNLPDTITTIDVYAFANSLIQEVNLPAGLTKIGNYAFDGCNELTTLTMSKATKFNTIPIYTFRGAVSLKYSRDENGELVDFVIPSNITKIDNYAFERIGVTKLTIPATVKSVGSYAFANAENLVSVDYQPAKMGSYMFANCIGLTTVKFGETTDCAAGTGAFDGCIALQYSEYISETDNKPFVFPKASTAIGSYILRNNLAITEIAIPASVKEIKANAFENMANLKKVVFPKTGSQLNATTGTFGGSIFKGCVSLDYDGLENFPTGLKKYGSLLFQGCTGLTKFTIPAGWTEVPASMFKDCVNLKTVTFGLDASGNSSVKTIAGSAFYGCDSLVSMTIPASVTAIKLSVFSGCDSLESVTLQNPDNVKELGSNAFLDCVSLKSFVMPKDLHPTNATVANTNIFKNCISLESVTFHKDTILEKIPNSMFEGCTSLKSITIPSTITAMGNYVFKDCSSLESITFGNVNALTTLGTEVFKGCSSLKAIDISTGLTTIGDSMFEGTGLNSISIPDSIKSIGKNAFKDCVNLTSVKFNTNTITEIPDYAFYNTPNLTKVELPSSVKKLGDFAFGYSGLTAFEIGANLTQLSGVSFSGCYDMKEFTVNLSNKAFTFENGMLLDADNSLVFYMISTTPENGTLTFPKDIKLAPKSFIGAKNVHTVIFEDGITEIPEYALYDADSVKTIILPATVKTIGAYAFAGCDSLEIITIPNSVTTLGTKVVGDDGVITYNGGVFANTPKLTNLTLSTALEEIMPYTFDGSGLTTITIPDSVTTICDFGFFNANKLTSITFGANVNSIGKYAFTECLSLPEITITGKDMVIGDFAFANVKAQGATNGIYEPMSIKTVTLGDGVKSVGLAAFRGAGVETLNVGPTVEMLGGYLFYKDETLKTINFAENSNLKGLGKYTFGYCNGLTEVSIPEGVEYLGEVTGVNSTTGAVSKMDGYTFMNCDNLVSVKLPTTLKGLGSNSFNGCDNLTELTIHTDCEHYGTNLFVQCKKLKKVTFTEGSKVVTAKMFSDCTSLETVELPSTITEIRSDAFKNCVNLKELYIPEGIEKLQSTAFMGLTNKTTIYFVNIDAPVAAWGQGTITGTSNSGWSAGCSAKLVFNAKPKAENQPQQTDAQQPLN